MCDLTTNYDEHSHYQTLLSTYIPPSLPAVGDLRMNLLVEPQFSTLPWVLVYSMLVTQTQGRPVRALGDA